MKIKNKHVASCVFLALLVLLPMSRVSAAPASSADFQIDFWKESSSADSLSSGDFQLQGSGTSVATTGSNSNFQIVPLGQIISDTITTDTPTVTTTTTTGGRGSGVDSQSTVSVDDETSAESADDEIPTDTVPEPDEETPVREEDPVSERVAVIPSAEDQEQSHTAAPEQLFDINFGLDDRVLERADQLSGFVTLENFGTAPQTLIDLTFLVLDADDDIVYRAKENLVVSTEELLRWDYDDIADLPVGTYTAVLQTLYGADVFDEFKVQFEIRPERGMWDFLQETWCVLSIGLLLVIVVCWAILLGIKKKTKAKRSLRDLIKRKIIDLFSGNTSNSSQ